MAALATPCATIPKFSQLTGLSEKTIRHQIDRGHLPSIKVGKRVLVDLYTLAKTGESAK